jgi:hypothetical protein
MALRVTEEELRELLVTRLEVDDHLRSLVMMDEVLRVAL